MKFLTLFTLLLTFNSFATDLTNYRCIENVFKKTECEKHKYDNGGVESVGFGYSYECSRKVLLENNDGKVEKLFLKSHGDAHYKQAFPVSLVTLGTSVIIASTVVAAKAKKIAIKDLNEKLEDLSLELPSCNN